MLDQSNREANGTHGFDPSATFLPLILGTPVAIFLGVSAIVVGRQEGFTSRVPVAAILASSMLLGLIAHRVTLIGRVVEVSDGGIAMLGRGGNPLDSIRWAELAKVTAGHKMSQLVLWDGAGNRRVTVSRYVEGFDQIRARILQEYEQRFVPAPLPLELRRPNFWTVDVIISIGGAVVMGWVSLGIIRGGQQVSGLVLLGISEMPLFIYFLSVNPQFLGPSTLFQDRIVLRSLFRSTLIYKKDVASVEVKDFSAGQSGPSSMVVVNVCDGRQLKILQRYGSLPEIYLMLRSWLAQK